MFLLYDSWYPKRWVAILTDEPHILDTICNTKIDIIMGSCPNAQENSEDIMPGYDGCADNTIWDSEKEDTPYLPLICYMLRRNIEISYFESKVFWSLKGYCVRSCADIERLANLKCMAYDTMTLLAIQERISCILPVHRKPVLISTKKSKSA